MSASPPAPSPDPSPDTGDLAATRVGYRAGELGEADLAATPLGQFERWYADAAAAAAAGHLAEPNAMVCATADADGRPAVRTVLLKGVGGDGFRFFTHTTSRKGAHLAGRPDVALLFGWHAIQRQVAVLGRAQPLPREDVAEYFASRPYGSRIGALASRQSTVAGSREEVDRAAAQLSARHPDTGSPGDVPVPEGWGGYLVVAREVEFWQGRPSRLHDRLVYVGGGGGAALDDPGAWRLERRWP